MALRRRSPGTPPTDVDWPRRDQGYLGLPPLRRSIGAMAPATHTTDHASWIGSWRPTGLLTELGHALDPTSPAGVVDGLASMGTPGSWAESTDLPVAVERFEEHT
ncbi:MAG: hypothetical protein ACRDQ5_10600, partial [Sciscionella sp.]